MAFTKKEIVNQKIKKITVISYIVLSALFIIFSLYNNLKNTVYNVGVNQGREIAISQVISAASKECKPLNIFVGEQKLDIINVACLQQAPEQTSTAPEVQ
jgi:hypothetical protein